MRERKSLVLITVDCLRADHVGFMGYPRPTTPFLDSLAKDSFVIPAAIVAGVPTYYSLPSILGSRFPLSLGRDVLGLAPSEPTLATILQSRGYATACFSAANPYISARFGYEQGFDTFCDFLNNDAVQPNTTVDRNSKGHGWANRLNRGIQKVRPAMGPIGKVYDDLYFEYCQRTMPSPESLDALRRFPSADVIVDHALKWLSAVGDSPFFVWLHFMDPHSPYYPKESAMASVSGSSVIPYQARYLNSYWNRSDLGARRLRKSCGKIVELYDAGIRWVDEQLARLARYLGESNLWQDCIFALTADHGEEFLDHGGRYHPPSRLTEELVRVPLLLRIPGTEKREQQTAPFSLIHLAPTLLQSLGESPSAEFQGKNQLTPLLTGQYFEEPAISECVDGCTNPFHWEKRKGPRLLSARTSRYKLVVHFGSGKEDLYDLERDPGERDSLPGTEARAIRRHLLDVAREHLKQTIDRRNQQARLGTMLRELRLELLVSPKQVSEP